MTITLVTWAAIYFIVWWLTLFVVLPFGVRTQAEEGDVVPGSDPSAPARHRVGRVIVTTTLVATPIFLVVLWVLTQTWFTIDDVPFLPRYG